MRDIVYNRYAIKRQIRKGPTATIFLANDLEMDRDVAIKHIRSAPNNTALISETKREIRFLSKLNHENIIGIYDKFTWNDGIALILPYIDDSLERIINISDSYKREFILNSAKQIAYGIDYCNFRGISHRDLKPSNILIDVDGVVKIIDFGISAEFDDQNLWKITVGTKPYIPPEAFLNQNDSFGRLGTPGEDENNRNHYDQFSFGVLLYQFITRELPFSDKTNPCTSFNLMSGHEFKPCHEINSSIPDKVNDVIRRMLSIQPQDRYPDNDAAMEEFQDALLGNILGHHKLFICYARENSENVKAVSKILSDKGLNIWMDSAINTGDNWADEIELAMREADAMIVFITQASCNSTEVKNEWNYWLEILKKRIIPVVTEECIIPYRLFPLHYIDAKDWGSDRIANAILDSLSKSIISEPPKFEKVKTTQLIFPSIVNEPEEEKGEEQFVPDDFPEDSIVDEQRIIETPNFILVPPEEQNKFDDKFWKLTGFVNGKLCEFEYDFHLDRNTERTEFDTCHIGRDPDQCEFVMEDAAISRIHADLSFFPDQGLGIRDMGSSSGTRVEDQLIGEDYVILRHGHTIAIGDTILTFTTEYITIMLSGPMSE